jgi:hypothetical protein
MLFVSLGNLEARDRQAKIGSIVEGKPAGAKAFGRFIALDQQRVVLDDSL